MWEFELPSARRDARHRHDSGELRMSVGMRHFQSNFQNRTMNFKPTQ